MTVGVVGLVFQQLAVGYRPSRPAQAHECTKRPELLACTKFNIRSCIKPVLHLVARRDVRRHQVVTVKPIRRHHEIRLILQHDADYRQNCRETRNIMTSKQQQHLLLDSLNERGHSFSLPGFTVQTLTRSVLWYKNIV